MNGGGSGAAAPNAAPWFVKAVPAIPALAAPTNLSVIPGDGYLDISWDAVSGATGYDVRAKTAGSSDWHDVASDISGTSYRYTTDKTIDYVAVRARNADTVGPWTELLTSAGPRLAEHRPVVGRRVDRLRAIPEPARRADGLDGDARKQRPR